MKRSIWSPVYFLLFTGLLAAAHFVHAHWRKWKHGSLHVELVGAPEHIQKNLKIYLAEGTTGSRLQLSDTSWMRKHPESAKLIFENGNWKSMPLEFNSQRLIIQNGKWLRHFKFREHEDSGSNILVELSVFEFGGIPHLAAQVYGNEVLIDEVKFVPFSNADWKFYYR